MTMRPSLMGLAVLGLTGAAGKDVQEYKPAGADCESCRYRAQRDERTRQDGAHCYMFRERPARGWCEQFRAGSVGEVAAASHDAAVEAIRADRQRRKLENFLKRQPKAKP